MTSKTTNRFSPEVRSRAVRLLLVMFGTDCQSRRRGVILDDLVAKRRWIGTRPRHVGLANRKLVHADKRLRSLGFEDVPTVKVNAG